jgi:hypothetical protein
MSNGNLTDYVKVYQQCDIAKAKISYQIIRSLELITGSLDLEPYYWFPTLTLYGRKFSQLDSDGNELFPGADGGINDYPGWASLPISASRHLFFWEGKKKESSAVDCVVVVELLPEFDLSDLDLDGLANGQDFVLSGVKGLARFHLYKLIEPIQKKRFIDIFDDDESDYFDEPGWHNTGTPQMKVLVKCFTLAALLGEPQTVLEEITPYLEIDYVVPEI